MADTNPSSASTRPIIGITADAEDGKYLSAFTYAAAVERAGGTPVILPHLIERLDDYLALCDGFIFTGGDDPTMEPFGEPTHPKAKPIDETRQAFECALMKRVRTEQRPALGICLGMQLMCLIAGGRLNQHLPDTLDSHDLHWGKKEHEITGSLGQGKVLSHHRQAIEEAGEGLEVTARAKEDGVIEAVHDPSLPFYHGIQWHPERTGAGPLGDGLFAALVEACRE